MPERAIDAAGAAAFVPDMAGTAGASLPRGIMLAQNATDPAAGGAAPAAPAAPGVAAPVADGAGSAAADGAGRLVDAANLAATHDLTMWGLFLQADMVVKLVMLVLLLASVWVWAIVFEKVVSLRRANRAATAFEERFWSGGSLQELYEREGASPSHPMAAVFGAAMGEWQRSGRVAGADMSRSGTQQRAERAMDVTIQREMGRLERWMVFLASVGSVAPFVGLFGTVWGIMNSFSAIAQMQNTNLAVVAPGIAEALFATAIGLVAAIPAVLAYNKISTDLARFAARMEAFAAEFGAILSRQSEEHA